MSNLVLGIKLKADGSGLVGELKNAKGEITKFGNASDRTSIQTRRLSTTSLAASNASGQLGRSISGVLSPVRLLAGGFAALIATMGVSQLIKMTDTMTGLQNQLKLVTGSSDELRNTQALLLTVSNDTYSSVVETTNLYAKLFRATRTLKTGQKDLLDVTRAINQSFIISGSSQQEAAGSTRQLAQALASGTFRGDEFNSVAEQAPRLMQALKDETGKTTGELRKMAEQGQLTSELVIRALTHQSDVINKEFGKIRPTMGQAATVIENNVLTVIDSFNKMTKASKDIGDGLIWVADQFKKLNEFIASGKMDGYLKAIAGQWRAWSDDVTDSVKITSDYLNDPNNYQKQMLQLSAWTNKTLKDLGNAFVNFPTNVRAMVKILAVELANLAVIGSAYAESFGRVIGVQLAYLPTIGAENIVAFGQVIGVQMGKIVHKMGIYGNEILDQLNIFDGDSFDINAALAAADKIGVGMTNQILSQKDKQLAANRKVRDDTVAGYLHEAEVKIAASKTARASTISDIMNERQAALDSFEKQIAAANLLKTIKTTPAANDSKGSDPATQKDEIADPLGKALTDKQLQTLRDSLTAKEDLLKAHHDRRRDLIADAWQNEQITDEQALALQAANHKKYQDELEAMETARSNMILSSGAQTFDALAGLAKTFGGEQSKAYKTLFAVSKGFAIAQGVMNLSLALSNAAAATPWYMAIPAMANAAATGASLIANIKGATLQGQAHGGLEKNTREGTWWLRNDEMVLNPTQRRSFEGLVAANENGGMSGKGGNSYQFNPNINIDAKGAQPGMEAAIESRVRAALEEYDATLQQDFASNGPRSQMLSGRAA